MKIISTFLILLVFLTACGSRPPTANATASPAATVVVPTVLPTQTATLVPTPTAPPTPTPTPPDIGKSYTGYWLKLSKEIGPSKSQTMTLYYQDGYNLTSIATFCVRAGDINTPNGFYFIAIDRPTTYPTAHGGYATTFFSHNFAIKLANRNWYLHAAPWNTMGINGCPTNGSGGCVNMRTDDFNILLNGGKYVNPITGEVSIIPDISVGTPFAIVATEGVCKYLGNCMNAMQCKTGGECWRMYTCQSCTTNAVSKWNSLVALAPFLKILDIPDP